jgi:hypothetical protein
VSQEGRHLAHKVTISLLLTSSISAILSSVIVISVVGSRSRNPNLLRRLAMTACVTHRRALRYAGGSARGLLHHHPGHCPGLARMRSAVTLRSTSVQDNRMRNGAPLA